MCVDRFEVNQSPALRVDVNLIPRKPVVDQARTADRCVANDVVHFNRGLGRATSRPVMNEPTSKAEIEIGFVDDRHAGDRWKR
jgi:hypothetical protein